MLSFSIDQLETEGVRIIDVKGEADSAVSPSLLPMVKDALEPGGRLVLDMSGVTFADSTAIAVVVAGHAEAKMKGGRFICVSSPGFTDKLERLGIGKLVRLVPTRDEAVEELRR